MRGLTVSRRRFFSQGLGACLTLAATGRAALADTSVNLSEVRVSDFAFAPDPLEITVGDRVVWINEDLAPHTATAVDGSWDTGRFREGEQVYMDFTKPGRFEYYCVFHPHMTARIVVLPDKDT